MGFILDIVFWVLFFGGKGMDFSIKLILLVGAGGYLERDDYLYGKGLRNEVFFIVEVF